MTQDPYNYGTQREAPRAAAPDALSPQDERTWSMLAHLSIFVNLLTGVFGPVVALLIWLVYKDRSQKVAFHALQSLWYQIAWLVILTVGWMVSVILMLVLIGFLLALIMIPISLVPFVHAAYGAYRVYQGEEFRYPWIADMVERR